MNNKKKIFILPLALLLVCKLYSQNKDIDNVPTEIRKPVNVCGTEDKGPLLYDPKCIKLNKFDKNLYIADCKNHRVVVLNDNLEYIRDFGRRGGGPVEFNEPNLIRFDNEGNLLILDFLNFRIQRITPLGKYLSSFSNTKFSSMLNFNVNKDNRIYFNSAKDGTLTVVTDIMGNALFKFGELFVKDNDPQFRHLSNEQIFEFDEEGNSYCAFIHKPVLRKYDREFNMIFEINLKYIPEIRERLRRFNERVGKFKKEEGITLDRMSLIRKHLIECISVDDKYIYLPLYHNSLYKLNKNNGAIVSKYILKSIAENYDEKNVYISYIDASSKDFIYAIESRNFLILKYEK